MRKLIFLLLVLLCPSFGYADEQKTDIQVKPPEEVVIENDDFMRRFPEEFRKFESDRMPGFQHPGGDRFTFGPEGILEWPPKKVSIDIKDADLVLLAELLSGQTGITFIVDPDVPANLKITSRVSNMPLKRLLDTLVAATGLMYRAESRDTGQGLEEKPSLPPVPPEGDSKHSRFARLLASARPVTHVTIYSLKDRGVTVNMGKVTASLKNADPIVAVTELLKQVDGAGYMVMSLTDYLSLQDAERAQQILNAVVSTERPKITLELRNTTIPEALVRLSEKGKFYITAPRAGVPYYLIIPDIVVTDRQVLPGLPSAEYLPPELRPRDQAICMERTKLMAQKLLEYAAKNNGRLPAAEEWMKRVPVPGGYQPYYAMNAYLSGMKLSSVRDPGRVVLLFESDENKTSGTEKDVIKVQRHPDGVVYAFVDGHVEVRKDIPNFKP